MANHLIIGLGGTGGSIIRSLRKRIYEEFRSTDPKGSTNIEYLYVDSSLADLNNEEDWQVLGASVQLDPSQRLSINGFGVEVLNNLDQYPGINSFISRQDQTMLQEGVGAIIGEGIGGQRRRFGRMLIANNMRGLPQNTFMGRLHNRVKELKAKEDVADVTFHVCAGLGGGTGSGSIVDVITQIRNEFRQSGGDNKMYKIQLYLYVPEKIIQIPGGEDSNRFYQPNGYAALMELNAMSVGKYHPTDVKGNMDEKGHVRRLLDNQDAFDMAYLFTNTNEAGREVNLRKVLPSIVGDFLFQKIVSPSSGGGKMVRLETNENNGLLPEQNELGEAVHSRKFMTFGVKRIEYPETEVVEYGAYRLARQASLQMLNGIWDDARGFLDECTEDMVGMSYKHDLMKPEELQNNLLLDEYLTLGKPLPSIEKAATNWRPISSGWEFYVDRYKNDTQKKCPKKTWVEEFNQLCDKFYNQMYRGVGVNKFYQDYQDQIGGFAEEIVRQIENNLFSDWRNGKKSMLEIHKYVNTLIANLDERIDDFNARVGKRAKVLEEVIPVELGNIREEWKKINWLLDGMTSNSVRVFTKFANKKREELIYMTQKEAFRYAAKLATEVKTFLLQLNLNAIEPFKKNLADFADAMKRMAEDKCKLSDADNINLQGEVVKEYDPRVVRNAVVGFLQNRQRQEEYATGLRQHIIEAVGTMDTSFTMLAKKMNQMALLSVTLKNCIEYSRKELDDYSVKNPNQRLVNVNILDKLYNTECSTPEKMKRFAESIYNAAQSFLTFNLAEEGMGSPETAANHQKIIQLSLPKYEDNDQFREDFIRAFGNSGTIPFTKDDDVSENFKSNQIVVVTAHSGFPLRYVDNLRVLKEKYDVLVRNEVNKMVVHTESFAKPLPALYGKNGAEIEKEMRPVVLLAYALGNIIVEREDPETGMKYKAFAGEKNLMGLVSRWIEVGGNIMETLEELSKVSRAQDAAALKKAVQMELETNYKHIEKKKALMLKMGETLMNVILPLCGGNDQNPTFIDFNTAAEKLCNDGLAL